MTGKTEAEYTIGKDVDLKQEQQRTLAAPQLPANLVLRMMFSFFDLVYGRERTLPKFKVLEILARYPYWAWENGAYHRLSRLYSTSAQAPPARTEDLLRLIELARDSQDNEQWHLLLLEEIIHSKGIKLSRLHHCLIPSIMTFGYNLLSKLIFRVSPAWSYKMNAAFESHAEHEYMRLAADHPEWDEEPVHSIYFDRYPRQNTLNDLLRRIALDERDHMNHSLNEAKKPRGSKETSE